MAEYRPDPTQPAANDISPALRVMLIEWRAAAIRQANSIGQLLDLDPVRTAREHERRRIVPRDGAPPGGDLTS